MRRLAPLVLFLFVPPLLAEPAEPKGPVAREIKVAVRLEDRAGRFSMPTKIASAADLAKAIADKGSQDRLAKEVDFTKEYVLLFAWAGSGGDKLGFAIDKGKAGPEAVFTFTGGLTRDLRRHVKVFALPNNTAWRMADRPGRK